MLICEESASCDPTTVSALESSGRIWLTLPSPIVTVPVMDGFRNTLLLNTVRTAS